MRNPLMLVACCTLLAWIPVTADVLDPESPELDILLDLSPRAEKVGLDVAFNLNLREVANPQPQRPILGALIDIPPLARPMSEEIALWEAAFGQGEIGVLALNFGTEAPPLNVTFSAFYAAWLNAKASERVFISYHVADQEAVFALSQELASTHSVLLLSNQELGALVQVDGAVGAESAGRLFATTGYRLVVDSAQARNYRSDISEFLYLGEAVRRNSNSVINPNSRASRRLATAEPTVFMKESLGDEFEASTIPEIIVPGGIALGEEAVFDDDYIDLVFESDQFFLLDAGGRRFKLPLDDVRIWKASYDLAARLAMIESDAIVDIDERGRVKLSTALTNTDLGGEMIRIDTEPFKHVSRLDVTKSVIIDTEVRFVSNGADMDFETEYEVRFLQADRRRIARTRAAVVYQYLSADGVVERRDSWGPEAFRLVGRTDFQGLGDSTADIAYYAAWVALFRSALDNTIDFSRGRYEFMKIDKSGTSTPSRVR